MKKSEMVEKMRGHFRGAQNLGSETAIFNYILDRMIEAGMEPPKRAIQSTQQLCDGTTRIVEHFENSWEEE